MKDHRPEPELPPASEIEAVAMRLHRGGAPALETVAGWRVLYVPAGTVKYSTTEVDPFTQERGQTVRHDTPRSAYCVFGYGTESAVTLTWKDGDASPPTWSKAK